MNSLCPGCGRSFAHENKLDPAPTCPQCAARAVSPTANHGPEPNPFLLLESCSGCGETVRPHWTTCPVCQTPLHGQIPRHGDAPGHSQPPLHGGEIPSPGNPFSPPVHVEKEVRRDLQWAGIAMICLAAAGLSGIAMSFFQGGMALRSDDRLLGFGMIVFAAMVGGGLVGASKKKEGAVAKGVLMGFLGGLGAIFLVMAITVLIVVCIVIFFILTCMARINH